MKQMNEFLSFSVIAGMLLIMVPLISCAEDRPSAANEATIYAPLQRVLENPKAYDLKNVAVVGYLGNGSGDRLYLSKLHAAFSDIVSAAFLNLSAGPTDLSACADNGVRVFGLFSNANAGQDRIIYVDKIFVNVGDALEECWPN